jgi:hypothetical protein
LAAVKRVSSGLFAGMVIVIVKAITVICCIKNTLLFVSFQPYIPANGNAGQLISGKCILPD